MVARLEPFTLQETNLYVGHRLLVAGYDFRALLFTPRAGAMIAEHSEGIPRNINNICFNALSLGCALKRKPIDEEIIREVLDDLDLGSENGMEATIREPRKSAPKASTAAASAGMKTHGWAWPSRCAAVAILLLMLMWPLGAGQRHTKVHAPQTSPGAVANAARFSSRILSASPNVPDFQARDTAEKSLLH